MRGGWRGRKRGRQQIGNKGAAHTKTTHATISSLKVPNRLPDRDLYSSAIEACVADGQMEAALDQVDSLDRRGLKPTQAGYVTITTN